MNDLPDIPPGIFDDAEAERVTTGHVFTEGPLWHPGGFYYFNDIRPGTLYRLEIGKAPERLRKTEGGNGLTFDLEGRLIHCEGEARRVTRTEHDGTVTGLAERFDGGRFGVANWQCPEEAITR